MTDPMVFTLGYLLGFVSGLLIAVRRTK